MHGYHGRLLRVDLAGPKSEVEALPEEYLRRFIGGKGLGAKLLFEEVAAGQEPLDPRTPVFFAAGPFVGTRIPTSARLSLVSKSPLTGIYLDSSVGDRLGPTLRAAGYDAMALTGQAARPVVLLVDAEGARTEPAGELWGKGCLETAQRLKERYPGSAVACIGPAGEREVLYSCIYSEARFAGRGGGGALLGRKQVKAIVLLGGDRKVSIANPEAFDAGVRECHEKIQAHPVVRRGGPLQTYGTPNVVALLQAMGVLPTRNWQANTFEHAENISGEAMRSRMFKALEPCTGCPIACGKLSEIRQGPFAGTQVRGPELETVYALGSLVALDAIEKVAYANHLCNDLGLDTISTGVTIAFAMELFERGIITSGDTDGMELRFGDADAVCGLIRKIAYREGLGDLLAGGTRRAARSIGSGAEAYAMHTKGLELPAYDPRGMKAMGLAYATADRGGCHLRASTLNIELRGLVDERVDRFAHQGKAKYIKNIQDAWATADALTYCKFGGYAIVPPLAAKLLEAITGVEYGLDGLLEAGERIYNLTRLFNVREGLTRADDALPRRLLAEGTADGPSAGQTVDLDTMLDEYYDLRGWDRTGIPTAATLGRLGLEREGRAAGIDFGQRG